jgi:hypothetical protein
MVINNELNRITFQMSEVPILRRNDSGTKVVEESVE